MKKFTKSGPPARAGRGERPAGKPFARAEAAPKRAYAPRGGEVPKRPYTPRAGDAARRPYPPRDGAPKRPFVPRAAPAGAPRRSFGRDDEGPAPARSAYGNPYDRAQRPRRADEGQGGRSFTVNLDPDVARVFRGDASVNKALRLVLQIMQVVEGPPPGERPAPRPRGYQGSDEARGFSRKPPLAADDDEDVE